MSETQWLDDEEQDAWRAVVDVYWHLQEHVHRPVQEASDLSPTDYAMLVHLSETPTRSARMSDLAECSRLPSGQVTYRVDRLIKLGFLERRISGTDGRSREAALTEAGLDAFHSAAAIHVDAVRKRLLDNLTRAELLLLGSLMKKATGATGEP